MQAAAEKEAAAEEARIQKAAEEEIRKVVSQPNRKSLPPPSKHAANSPLTPLAWPSPWPANKSTSTPIPTRYLVRSFASKLASGNNGGKDGH